MQDIPDWLRNAPPGWAQRHGYTVPAAESPKRERFGNPAYGKPIERMDGLSDAEWSAYTQARHFNDKMAWASESGLGRRVGGGAPAPARPESPYDIVGGHSSGGVNYIGRPRWQVDLERQKAELEMEQLRWMIDQMKRNPYGANIRDLIYGKK